MSQVQVEGQKVQATVQGNQLKAQVEMAKTNANNAVQNKEADIKFLEVMSSIQDANLSHALDQEKVDAENARTTLEKTLKLGEHFAKMDAITKPEETKE